MLPIILSLILAGKVYYYLYRKTESYYFVFKERLKILCFSPNTPGLRSLQKKEELQQLLTEVNKARQSIKTEKNPPLLLKLAPDLDEEEMKDIVSVITKKQSKVDGLIISNTTIDRTGLVNQEFSTETGGLSGKPLTNKSTEMIKKMYKLTKGLFLSNLVILLVTNILLLYLELISKLHSISVK